jgi:DNA-binding transcriptional MerR regulator
MTVAEAAKALDVSPQAIRNRIKRETIEHEKDPDTGQIYVYLDIEQEENKGDNAVANPLIDTLRSQVEELQGDKAYLREENHRLQLLIAQLTQKIPDPPREEQKAIEGKSFWQKLLGR